MRLWIGDDVLDDTIEEVGWLDSFAGADTAPSLTITCERRLTRRETEGYADDTATVQRWIDGRVD